MSKKYKLTDETINLNGVTLYRIEALKYFGEIKKGDKGGFIESENNLAHEGDAWVSDDACVYDNARVSDNASVSNNARVYGNAWLYGNTRVCDYAWVADNARVYGDANVCDDSSVFGSACVYDNAHVYGDALVRGYACVCGDAEISNKSDYIVFQNWWSSGRYFTWTRSNNMWSVGCFYGTGDELIKKAYKDSELSGREYERVVRYIESILAEENLSKGTN